MITPKLRVVDNPVNVAGSVMLLHSGVYFDLLNPDPRLIEIEDIAHSLSNLCRYTGHIKKFYSVAEHSWLCSYLVPHEHRLEALLHDAGEAFTGDVASPFKGILSDYKAIEEPINHAIAARFHLRYPWSKDVRTVDLRMLAAEREQGMPLNGSWGCLQGVTPAPFAIQYWTPPTAEARFIERFQQLTNPAHEDDNADSGPDAA